MMQKYSEVDSYVRERFPEGSVEFDNQGQLVIYTGLRVSRKDPKMEKLVPLDSEEGES